MKTVSLFLVATIFVWASLTTGPGPAGARAQESASPPARSNAGQGLATAYKLGPGDKLKVTVFGQADLSGEFEVDGQGNLSIPLVGQLQAGGLTVAQFHEKLSTVLDRDFLVNPRVSVDVVNYRPFYILGEVNRPGRYDYVNGLTVRQAVAIAGGFTRRARTSDVVLVRDGLEADGSDFDYLDLEDLVLPGDTLEVERRLF